MVGLYQLLPNAITENKGIKYAIPTDENLEERESD